MKRKMMPRFVMPDTIPIDYKDVSTLQKFLNERGKIVSRRVSGVTAKQQRKITSAIKRARYLALLITGGVSK